MNHIKELVVLNKVTKKYNNIFALQDLNLVIESGDWVSICGPSGSGKTTLLNIISGLDKADEGLITVADENLNKLNENQLAKFRREKIGFVFQQQYLIPYLNILENVMLAQYFHSIPDEEEAVTALKKVGLEKRLKHKPSQLSGGEQQRVCIARALINSPLLLLADEPTGNLDKDNTIKVMELVKEIYLKEKFTVIIVTHNLLVANYAEKIIYLEDGKIKNEEKI